MSDQHSHVHSHCAPHPEMHKMFDTHAVPEGPRKRVKTQRSTSDAPHADLLVFGTIVTMNPEQPQVEALAATDGRILATGSRADLEYWRGPNTEIIELGDRVAFPGFIEPHMHLWSTVMCDSWIDCSPFTNQTFEDVKTTLRQAVAKAQPGEWVRGQLFDPALYPGEPNLTTDILDEIAPNNPLAVFNASMHFLYANSKAFEAAGINDQTPDPDGGSYFRENGHLTGVISEMPAIMPVISASPQMTHDELIEGLVRIMTRAAAAGVTKIHEAATGGLLGVAELDILHGLASAGQLPTRVTTAQYDGARAVWEKAGLQPGAGDDMVRAIGWKIVSDGSNQGRTGYMREPYMNSDSRGAADCTVEQLEESIRYANDHGWQCMVHANGDAALDLVITAYENALKGTQPNDLRHRIEHCSLATDEHFERMAAIGVSPSFLMNHVYYWGRAFQDHIIGPERASRLDSVASARRHGLRPSLHSDHSVSPIYPLRSVQTAVTRKVADGGAVLNSNECVDVYDALRAVTIDAAWQTHTDDAIGSLEVGKYCDMAILSADPRIVDRETIGDIKVLETRVAGTTTWSSENTAARSSAR